MTGVLWLLDGALRLQPFMFSTGFLTHIIAPAAQDQPAVVGEPMLAMAHLVSLHLVIWNACFAVTQIVIGLGLLVSRRTVKAALLASFVWSAIVWWFGEGLGMLVTSTASPLTGAPGAVILGWRANVLLVPGASG